MTEPAKPPSLEEFLAWCRAECEFLVNEYGFELLDSPREYNDFSVRYRKGPFGVDVYGENWGETASCDLIIGKEELYLGLYLPSAERGPHKKSRKRPSQLEQLTTIALLLKQHAPDFLRGDSSRFDVALAEWNYMTRPRELTEEQRLGREREQAIALAGHAYKRQDFAEVVRLLASHAAALSPHQRQMLETARQKLIND